MYYLQSKLLSYEEIKSKGDARDKTLLWNMRVNGYTHVFESANGWKYTAPFDANKDTITKREY